MKVDLLKEELKQKDLELESSRAEIEQLKEKFESFKTEYDENMHHLINEKIQKHLGSILNEVWLSFCFKARSSVFLKWFLISEKYRVFTARKSA